MGLLRELLSGLSAQRPSHSLYLGGEQLPLEARIGGIFLGFLCGVALLALLGRLHATEPPPRTVTAVCWALVGAMAFDGFNAFLFDGSLPHLYPPNTAARLATGLLAGLAVAVLSLPVVNAAMRSERDDVPAVHDLLELGAGVALAGLVWGVAMSGAGLLAWPLALAMLAGVLAAFGSANVYVLALVTREQVHGRAVAALGLTLLEVAGFGALHWVMQTALGLSWGF
jgi:uncharacterized membrane protein